ncbi:MAG: hypothetical protein EZS28_042522, partial [Streblomastix strix]
EISRMGAIVAVAALSIKLHSKQVVGQLFVINE